LEQGILPERSKSIRETNRSLLLSLASLSFAGLMAVALTDSAVADDLQFPIYFLLVSFLSFLTAIGAQQRLNRQRDNQNSIALIDMGILSLIMSVISVVFIVRGGGVFEFVFAAVALLVFFRNHVNHLRVTIRTLPKSG
jgi:hypothetical protein